MLQHTVFVIIFFATCLCAQESIVETADGIPNKIPGVPREIHFGDIRGAAAARVQKNLDRYDEVGRSIQLPSTDHRIIMSYQLAKELDLSKKQVERLNRIAEPSYAEFQTTVFQQMGTEGNFQEGFPAQFQLESEAFAKYLRLLDEKYKELKKSVNAQTARILNGKQLKRLNQIKLQHQIIRSQHPEIVFEELGLDIPTDPEEIRRLVHEAETTRKIRFYGPRLFYRKLKLKAIRDTIGKRQSTELFGETLDFGKSEFDVSQVEMDEPSPRRNEARRRSP